MLYRTLLVFVVVAGVSAQGTPVFEPIQPEVMGDGLTFANAFADYDNDGDLDLLVGFDGKPNRLYRNDKGVFTDVASAAGSATLIDTWEMTEKTLAESVERGDVLHFSPKPYQALLFKRVDGE